MPQTTDQLKPCPFCEGSPFWQSEHDSDGFGVFWAIRCACCGNGTQQHFVSNGNDCPQFRAEVRHSWNARAVATSSQLRSTILRLPCKPKWNLSEIGTFAQAYEFGHRDARHAAAELVSAVPLVAEAPREPTRDEYHAANQCLDAAVLHLTGSTSWPEGWLPLRDQLLGIMRSAYRAAPPVSLAPMPEEWLKEAERLCPGCNVWVKPTTPCLPEYRSPGCINAGVQEVPRG